MKGNWNRNRYIAEVLKGWVVQSNDLLYPFHDSLIRPIIPGSKAIPSAPQKPSLVPHSIPTPFHSPSPFPLPLLPHQTSCRGAQPDLGPDHLPLAFVGDDVLDDLGDRSVRAHSRDGPGPAVQEDAAVDGRQLLGNGVRDGRELPEEVRDGGGGDVDGEPERGGHGVFTVGREERQSR